MNDYDVIAIGLPGEHCVFAPAWLFVFDRRATAPIGLILIMLGAIQKKIFTWHISFWGKHASDGWSYDTIMVVMNLVIASTAGGRFVLDRLSHSATPHP
jgi:hypothetical protein